MCHKNIICQLIFIFASSIMSWIVIMELKKNYHLTTDSFLLQWQADYVSKSR